MMMLLRYLDDVYFFAPFGDLWPFFIGGCGGPDCGDGPPAFDGACPLLACGIYGTGGDGGPCGSLT